MARNGHRHQLHPHLDSILGPNVLVPKASLFTSPAGGVPSGATEGSSMGPGSDHLFFTFFGLFQDLFSEHFFMIFGSKMGSKIWSKLIPKSVLFSVLVGDSFFRSLSSLETLFGSLLGLLGPSWGVSRAKNAHSPMRKPLFESRLFGISELHLALLGSSRPLPG